MARFVDLTWTSLSTILLVTFGFGLFMRGLGSLYTSLVPARGNLDDLLTGVRGFRLSIIGLALIGGTAAWVTHQPVLLALALGIGGVEVLESSIVIWALQRRRSSLAAQPPG